MKISSTFDNQGGELYKDRYWGDVPMFLKYIPERKICVPNEDFIQLVNGFIDGSIDPHNISVEMQRNLRIIAEIINDPRKACLVDKQYELIVRVIMGSENPCEDSARSVVGCDETVCCGATFSCTAIV